MGSGMCYAMTMGQLRDERSTGSRTPFLLGAQAGLILLALPCVVNPSFEGMYGDFADVLPPVTDLVMSPFYGLGGGLLVLGMLARAFLHRDRVARPELLAWSAVLLGLCLLLLYVFGLIAPMRPL
jgi:type II secretory pathway component PulF